MLIRDEPANSPVWLGRSCFRVCNAEVSAVAPHAMQDDRHLARQRDARLLEAGAPGELRPQLLSGLDARVRVSMALAAS
jgi:hypothetical protein